jgi:hypothetical protein
LYYKIEKVNGDTFIKLLINKIDNETNKLFRKIEKDYNGGFIKSYFNTFKFVDIELEPIQINTIFEKYGIPFIDVKKTNLEEYIYLNSGEFQNIPLYCLPSYYLNYLIENTYDNKIKEYSQKIIKKRLLP